MREVILGLAFVTAFSGHALAQAPWGLPEKQNPTIEDLVRGLSANLPAPDREAIERSFSGDSAGALETIDNALVENPNQPGLHAQRLSLMMQVGDYAQALSSAEALVRLRGRQFSYHMAPPLMGLQRHSRAVRALEAAYSSAEPRAALIDPPSVQRLYDRLPRQEQAAFVGQLDLHPRSPVARLIKGYLLQSSDLPAALLEMNESLRLSPNFYDARQRRLYVYIQLEDDRGIVQDLTWMIDNGPGYVFNYIDRGEARLRLGEYTAARRDFGVAIQLSPRDFRGYSGRCRARAIADTQLSEALRDCNEAIALSARSQPAYANRGLVYLRMNNPAQALASYEMSVSLGQTPEAVYGRGLAKLKMGDEAGGRADLASAVALNEDIAEEFEGYGLRP